MAPTLLPSDPSGNHLLHILSRSLTSISSRATDDTEPPPLASVFATIIKGAGNLGRRAIKEALAPRTSVPNEPVYLTPRSLQKRQNAVLAIPTTYAGLNSGPAPGAVVGIVLGSIAGFIVILYIILSAIRLSGWNTTREEVIVEEHHHRRSQTRSRSRSRAMTEVTPPRRERIVREREETVVVEEHMEPDSVIVDEEEDDIVEVIEEHSPERPPKRESRRSGFRTVDPAEFGGGGRPTRKLSKR